MEYKTDAVLDIRGNAIFNASVRVLTASKELATIFDVNGNQVNNPLVTDATGEFSVAVPNGKYFFEISVNGKVYETRGPISFFDPMDDGASSIGYGDRTVSDKLGEVADLGDFSTAAEAVAGRAGKRLLIAPGESVTVNVPDQFPSIPAAWDAIAGWVIADDATVTVKVADGTYVHTASVGLNHPFGHRIRLVGNEVTPANCVIQVAAAGFDCFVVGNGHTLGYFNGFKLFKTVKALAADNSTGLLAVRGARIICGQQVVVDNWYYGIAARDGSFIYAPNASVDHAGDVGIWAFVGSTVDCPNAVSNNAADVANGWGFGFQAEYGSAMNCSGASASGCQIGGIASLSNSNVRALGATASNNTGSGFVARDGATIECHAATASSNTRYGVEVLADGRVYYSSLTTAGNTMGNHCARAYFDNGALGARLVADDGDLRIDTSGPRPIYFNTQGGLQFRIDHTANAANRWGVTGSASGQALVLAATGNDPNIIASVEAKGSQVARFKSNGKTAFQSYNASPDAVNYVQAAGSVAGSAVAVSAQGSDAVIDFGIFPKGAGSYVQIGAGFSANADAPVTGYITIKDSAGSLRKLAVIG